MLIEVIECDGGCACRRGTAAYGTILDPSINDVRGKYVACTRIGIAKEVGSYARGPGVIVARLMDKVFDHGARSLAFTSQPFASNVYLQLDS